MDSQLPALYRALEPLDSIKHRNLRYRIKDRPARFAAQASLLPLTFGEIPLAAREIPVMFVNNGGLPWPMAVLGLTSGKNDYIDATGKWNAAYVPAYLRRYPFLMAKGPAGNTIMAFDPTYDGFDTEDGEALFTDEGKPSEVLETLMRITTDFASAFTATEAVMRKVQEMNILRSISMNVQAVGRPNAQVNGFLMVDEMALRQLPDDRFLELRAQGALAGLYAHMMSVGGLIKLAGQGAP